MAFHSLKLVHRDSSGGVFLVSLVLVSLVSWVSLVLENYVSIPFPRTDYYRKRKMGCTNAGKTKTELLSILELGWELFLPKS